MGWIACPARNHRATSNRRIEPPLEGQRLNDSGGWTSHQVLRAHAAGLGLVEPTTFGLATLTFSPSQGHAGDGADCITTRPSFMPQATEKARNGRLQQIAANRFSTPQEVIAILLQGFVRPIVHLERLRALASTGFRTAFPPNPRSPRQVGNSRTKSDCRDPTPEP